MYRITLRCNRVDPESGVEVAESITEDFKNHRTWYRDVKCWYEDGGLLISAASDSDKDGIALLDEFGDTVVANVRENGPIEILSVEVI